MATWLSKYEIKVIYNRTNGYSLKYNESKLRLAIKDLAIHETKNIFETKSIIEYFFSDIDITSIRKSILQVESERNYRFTDQSFYEILIYCCLAYQRKEYSSITDIENLDYQIIQQYNEYVLTVDIFKKIQEKLGTLFSNNEVFYLSIQIMCSKFVNIPKYEETDKVAKLYDENLLNFVEESVGIIGNILEIDLVSDRKLIENLIIHFRGAIFRIMNEVNPDNTIIDLIKNRYNRVYRATCSIAIIFEKQYGLNITDNEICYIALYIQSSIERKKLSLEINLITDYPRGKLELVIQRMKDFIPEIEGVKSYTLRDLEFINNKNLTVSTIEAKNKNIVYVNDLLSDGGMLNLKKCVKDKLSMLIEQKGGFSNNSLSLFDPELLFINSNYSNKIDILKFMTDKMYDKGYISKDYYNSVLKREEATDTTVGNGICLTHGNHQEVYQSKVSIMIDKEGLKWNDENVKIIILLGFKMDDEKEILKIQNFYKEYIGNFENQNWSKKFIESSDSVEMFSRLFN